MLPQPRETPAHWRTAMTNGNSIGAGNAAAICTTGCNTRDSRLDKPIAIPAGRAHTVPISVEMSTRPSVMNPAAIEAPHTRAGTWCRRCTSFTPPQARTASRIPSVRKESRPAFRSATSGTGAGLPTTVTSCRLKRRRIRRASRRSTRMSRDARNQFRNQDVMSTCSPPSSTRNFCAHTTTGRHNSWSSTTIIVVMATIASTIALPRPCSTATLM